MASGILRDSRADGIHSGICSRHNSVDARLRGHDEQQ